MSLAGGEPQLPTSRVLPIAERAIQEHGSWRAFAAFSKSPSVNERTYYRMLSGPWDETVPLHVVDALVTAVDPGLWHHELADLLPVPRVRGHESRRGRKLGLRSDSKWTEGKVRSAHVLYRGGLSMLDIAQMVYGKLGYASAVTCEKQLGRAFRRLGLQTRPAGARWVMVDPRVVGPMVEDLHAGGMTCVDIGRAFFAEWGYKDAKSAAKAVRAVLELRGVPRLGPAESRRVGAVLARVRRGLPSDEEIARLYRSGLSSPEIARRTGDAERSVRRALERVGQPMRGYSEASRLAARKVAA